MYTLYAVFEDFVRRFGSREGLQANWRQLLPVASPSSQARLTNEGETAEAGGASQGVLYLSLSHFAMFRLEGPGCLWWFRIVGKGFTFMFNQSRSVYHDLNFLMPAGEISAPKLCSCI